ncbi:MAG: hypothetical protein WC797_03475 [Candidatus Paceibacterota bacterium]|jgi:hypothetical protein
MVKKITLVVILVLIVGGIFYLSKNMAPATTVVPQLSFLGELAKTSGSPITSVVGPEKTEIDAGGGVKLDVPANVFLENTELKVSKSDINLSGISFYVKQAFAYTVSSNKDLPSLSAPVVLEVPNPNKNLLALESAGNNQWKKVELNNSDPLKINITHFSDNTFVFVEPSLDNSYISGTPNIKSVSANDFSSSSTLGAPVVDAITAANNFIEKYANQYEKSFLGVGEVGNPKKECQELKDLIEANKGEWTFKFPTEIISDPVFSSLNMGMFLFTAKSPSAVSSESRLFWTAVLPSQEIIKKAILGSEKRLSPAEVLKIAVEANNGDVALGVLATHNFLKEMSNDGRDIIAENLGNPFTGELVPNVNIRSKVSDYSKTENGKLLESDAKLHGGELASHLMPWRSKDRSLAGSYDKMGPIYHIFAAMTASTYFPHFKGGDIATLGEGLMRGLGELGLTGDRMDPEKGLADNCGNSVGDQIAKLFLDNKMVSKGARFFPMIEGDSYNYSGGFGSGPICYIQQYSDDKPLPSGFTRQITISVDPETGEVSGSGQTNFAASSCKLEVKGKMDPKTKAIVGTITGESVLREHSTEWEIKNFGRTDVSTTFSGSINLSKFRESIYKNQTSGLNRTSWVWDGTYDIVFDSSKTDSDTKLEPGDMNNGPKAGKKETGTFHMDMVIKE